MLEGSCCKCDRTIKVDSMDLKSYYNCPKCNSFLSIEVKNESIETMLWEDFLELKNKDVKRETINRFEFLEKKGKSLTIEQKARVQGIMLR